MKGLTMLKIALCALTFIVVLVLVEGQKSSNTDLTIASESTATKTNKDIVLSETANRGAAGRSNTRSRAKLNLPKGKPKSTKGKRKRRKGRKNNAAKENDLPTDILRDTMLHMFGFNHMPTTTGEKPCDEGIDCNSNNPRSSRSSRTEGRRSVNFKPTPPDFMLELYRSYSEDKDLMMLHLKSQGNTVRSFFPSPADPMYREQNLGKSITITPVPASNSEGESSIPVFLFNLSSIPNIEDLVAAEIRVDGGNTNSDRSVVVGVYAVRETECNDEIDCDGTPTKMFNRVGKSLTLSSLSGSNSWSDSRLVNLAQKARRPGHVVVLKFDVDEGSNQRKRRHFDDDQTVAGDLPDAFYAHDHHETTRRSRREPNISPIMDSVADDIPSTSIPMLIVYCNDPRSKAEAETQTSAPVIWRALGNITSAMKKVKRSAPMPDDAPPSDGNSTDKRTRDVSPRNTPYVVEKRKKRRKNKQVPGNTTSEEQTTQRRRRKNRKGRKKGRKNNKIGIKLHPSINAEREDDKCGRKSLHVKFEDIGWSDWIISPQYFDAYYCSGMCKLPDMKESQTTNHALIQAAVKTIVGNDGIPAPCCVPDKLMSLSVLFFDEDRNVVLKVFPNMSVKSCACR